jgi:photosystem II stability/assembly factor-like uncharacterized protein
MRATAFVLVLTAFLPYAARAAEPVHFEDAALHAVQFIDREEGWAVGDEGVVWHTIDGGQSWERQPTGVRAALRAVQFLNPYTGWVVGREELPNGAGAVGVVLVTRDGGLKWRQVGRNMMPGLNAVHFVDHKTGFIAGDGTDQFATGLFATADGGHSWKPVAGPRSPSWLEMGFVDNQTGALAGAWGRMGALRQGKFEQVDIGPLGGRGVRGVRVVGKSAIAVGQGGLVLSSTDVATANWNPVELPVPTEVRAAWDFHALHGVGEHVWAAGRPGSALLHSADRGKTWEVLTTGQPLPVNAICFVDEHRGWTVGELGSILKTEDGGRNWHVQRRGGQRAAVLFVHARPTGLPVDTVAALGADEGYLAAALRVNAAAPSVDPARAADADRFAAAVRQAGGAAGEALWQFPLPQYLARSDKRDILAYWDRMHGDRAADELLRQLVLAIRVWRPDVVITDHPDASATGYPAEALVAEAVHEAFTRAADPAAFPEQVKKLGLEPWKVGKVYGRWDGAAGAQVTLELSDMNPRLQSAIRDFAAPAAGLLAGAPLALPSQRHYRLLDSRLDGASGHHDLMQGTALAPHGTARRDLKEPGEPAEPIVKAAQTRHRLEALAESGGGLADPGKLLAQIGPALKELPDDDGAATALAVAQGYARRGQWQFAREAFLLMADRYPANPLTADAYRWLVRHNTSSEARRRHELGQFLVVTQASFSQSTTVAPTPVGDKDSDAKSTTATVTQTGRLALLGDRQETRQWYQGALDVGKRLAAYGPLFATDPSMQFCLQAARRSLGDANTARQWYSRFCEEHADGPWRDAAAAEIWLTNRVGPPPKPVARCRATAVRPFLDGKLDDECWQDVKPLVLRDAAGETAAAYPTEAWLAHDEEYLYLALRCRHPEGHFVPPVAVRPRDADLRPYDRVSLMLDLDRDYSTYFHLQVDQRGCVCEDCWGDRSWDPRWFVAVHSDKECWQIEAAIPLKELTGDHPTPGSAWACNIVRVLPGHGVQAWSLPADVQPRPEGMGLLLFTPPAEKK